MKFKLNLLENKSMRRPERVWLGLQNPQIRFYLTVEYGLELCD
jgi:hypothetical protein